MWKTQLHWNANRMKISITSLFHVLYTIYFQMRSTDDYIVKNIQNKTEMEILGHFFYY